MIIYVLDENFRKIDILRKFTFAQYNDQFRGIGSFTINARIVKENLYLMNKDKQFYILFDRRIIGVVDQVSRDSDGQYEKTIVITGRLSTVLFSNRVINGTLSYKGYTYDYVKTLIEEYITKNPKSTRYVDIEVDLGGTEGENKLKSRCSSIDKQVTGGYLWDEIYPILEQDQLGLSFVPVGDNLIADPVNGIKQWKLTILAGVDRTKENKEGNVPVIFSQSLSNIERTAYATNRTNYKNVAYVAGEGEGKDRKWYEVFTDDSGKTESGWERRELWIDARDVQSEEGGTESDYEEMIQQRADEKFSEARIVETYSATIIEANKQYQLGVHYNKGDFVTIVDDELGISIDVQITEITKSVEGNSEIVDVGYVYGTVKEDILNRVDKIEGKIEATQNDIKYIERELDKKQSDFENKLSKKEDLQKRVNNSSSVYFKDGYDCHLHAADTPASDVVVTLSKNYKPRGGKVAVSGWCQNKSNGEFYPCVGRINSDGSWAYLSAMTSFGMTDVYYIYNKSEGISRVSNFNVWLSGSWATNTNGN